MNTESINLVRPNFKHKTDVLNRGRIPDEAADLNFRPPSAYVAPNFGTLLGFLVLTSILAAVIGIFLRIVVGPLMLSPAAGVCSLVVGLILAVFAALNFGETKPQQQTSLARFQTAALAFLAVPMLWLAVVIATSTKSISVALFALVGIAFPAVCYAADRMATHFVYWMTAHPRIDRQTMTSWRLDWSDRFQDMPDRKPRKSRLNQRDRQSHQLAMQLRRSYRRGFLWLLACFVIPVVVTAIAALHGFAIRTGQWIILGTLLCLLWMACLRHAQAPVSLSTLFRALWSWLTYGKDRTDPPWVFRSPVGDQLERAATAIVAVSLLSMALVPIAGFTVASTIPLANGSGFVATAEASTGFSERIAETASKLVTAETLLPRSLILTVLLTVGAPPLVFILACYIVTGPALAAHYIAMEAPAAYEQHHTWSEFDGYTYRLVHSRNPIERESLLLGYNPTHEYPLLLHRDLLFEHMHIVGATGIGKTALGLSRLAIQLIRRGDGPVIVIDCKGDPAFFHTVRIEAERAGRRFKWFTNKPHRSTYIFNPFTQDHLRELTVSEVVGLFIQSLNLYHGDDYGRAWFGMNARTLFSRAVQLTLANPPRRRSGQNSAAAEQQALFPKFPPIESFDDLSEILPFLTTNSDEFKSAQHLSFIVQSLVAFEQLNMSPARDSGHPALRHAIHMPEVIRDNQVVYFSLIGAMDVSSVGQIARLAWYSALTAAMAHRDATGKRPRLYVICDEAQTVIAQNIEVILAQARAYGMACVLSHQTMSQLNPPGAVDLRELVMSCTTVKQYFSARSPALQKIISEISGSTGYATLSWNQFKRRIIDGEIGPRYACADPDGVMRVGVQECIGPRLPVEDIQDINRDPNQSILAVERGEGYSHFHGAFPIYSDWPISKDEYRRRDLDIPWPAASEETLEISTAGWPESDPYTVVPQSHPPLIGPTETEISSQKLKDIKRRLEED